MYVVGMTINQLDECQLLDHKVFHIQAIIESSPECGQIYPTIPILMCGIYTILRKLKGCSLMIFDLKNWIPSLTQLDIVMTVLFAAMGAYK